MNLNMNMTGPKRQTIRLTEDEIDRLFEITSVHGNSLKLAHTAGIHKHTLRYIMMKGSGTVEAIEKIRLAMLSF